MALTQSQWHLCESEQVDVIPLTQVKGQTTVLSLVCSSSCLVLEGLCVMTFLTEQLEILLVECDVLVILVVLIDLDDVVDNALAFDESVTHLTSHPLSLSDSVSQSPPSLRIVES